MLNNIYCWKIMDYSMDSVARVVESKDSKFFFSQQAILIPTESFCLDAIVEAFLFLLVLKNIKLYNFIGVDFL